MVLLEARDLVRRFGGILALSDYSLCLKAGELVGLIGPNGAGKTTAFNLLTGILAPSSGTVLLGDADLTGRRVERFAEAGIARTFQNIRLFADLTAWENVAVGYHMRRGPGWLEALLPLPGTRRREAEIRELAAERLRDVGLLDEVDRRAGDLPYGHKRRLEIARALATEPRVLLLDEPAAGMNPVETAALVDTIGGLNERSGLAVVLVEHDMRLVMTLCRRLQVLDRGVLIAQGSPAEIRAHPDVVSAYLGRRRRRERADA